MALGVTADASVGVAAGAHPAATDLPAANAALARAIAEGGVDSADPALLAHLWQSTFERLAVDQPRLCVVSRRGQPLDMTGRSPAVGFVLVNVFLDVLGIGLIIPVLPALVGQFTADAQHQSYWYGALVASYGLMQFIFSPVLGALSDRLGRRPVLLVSITGLGIDFLLMAFASSLPMLLAARVVGGITAATMSVSNAYIADIAPARSAWPRASAAGCGLRHGLHRRPVAGRRAGRDRSALASLPRRWRWSTRCTASSCCPNRCRRPGAWPFRWPAPIRSRRCVRLARRAVWAPCCGCMR